LKLSRTFVLLFVVGHLTGPAFAGQASRVGNLDPTLVRDLHLLESWRDDPSTTNLARLQAFRLPDDPDPELSVFLHFEAPPDGKLHTALEAHAVKLFPNTWLPPVGAHRTGFMLAKVRASSLRTMVKEGLVVRVSAAYRQLEPLNNLAAEQTGAAAARELDPPLTGEGIRLAVLDSGFQLEHGDLPEPAAAMDYADYPDTSEDVANTVLGHGTHVAGTAFGSGVLSEGRWRGMAPDAEPIYLKIGDDVTASASSAAVVGALRAAATWCEADIATMSYGGYDFFNDGSSEEEQAVDWAVSRGVTVFMSAGNSAADGIHYSGEVEPGDTTERVPILVRSADEDMFWDLVLSWYDDADISVHEQLAARIFDQDGELIGYDELDQVSSPRGTEVCIYMPYDPLPTENTTFLAEVISSSDSTQTFHLRIVSNHWNIRFHRPDQQYTVGLPSTADSCISVGSFISRRSWRDYLGELHETPDTIGTISYYSSRGPRIDGLLKPDIVAPGQKLISCRDTVIIQFESGYDNLIVSNNGEEGEPADYIALMGTSMSSPCAAGAAALILQANPELTPAELRNLIFSSARADEFTGEAPNIIWGYGRIDVMRALETPAVPAERAVIPRSIEIEAVYPNPFNGLFTVEYLSRGSGPVDIVLLDLMGREVWSTVSFVSTPGPHRFTVSGTVAAVASGDYILKIGDGIDWSAVRMTLIR